MESWTITQFLRLITNRKKENNVSHKERKGAQRKKSPRITLIYILLRRSGLRRDKANQEKLKRLQYLTVGIDVAAQPISAVKFCNQCCHG